MGNSDLNIEDILIDDPSDESLMEVPVDDKAFRWFIGLIAIVFLIVFVQIFRVGVVQGEFYKESALANMTKVKMDPAPRGIIHDRFGENLVENETVNQAWLSPISLPQMPTERSNVLKEAADILNIREADLVSRLQEHDWNKGRLLLDESLTHDELVEFSSKDLPGIEVETNFGRTYKNPTIFSHLMGYTSFVSKEDMEGRDLHFEEKIGKSGLEKFYDDELRGESGRAVTYMNARGEVQEEQSTNPPEKGKDVDTFIDAGLQRYFYYRMQSQLRSLGSVGGVGLAVKPQTGEVLSLLSFPSFDNRSVSEYLNRSNQPLFNRAVGGLYNPGSVIKPLVALAALEEGVVSSSEILISPGFLKVENPYNPDKPSVFKDWKPHGRVDLKKALAVSSNVYFYIVGGGHDGDSIYGIPQGKNGLGIDRLKSWWGMFRLNRKTGIDLPGEKAGILPDPEWKEQNIGDSWRVGDTYNVSIGQGSLLLTPLEIISYISAIANGGDIYKLRVAQRDDKKILAGLDQYFVRDSLEQVKAGMVDAVDKYYGTAHMLSDLPVEVAAKTGSAEVGKTSTNALFVGFAPVDNPEIALLILIEGSEEGSLNAVPVARDVLLWYYNNRLK